MIVQTNPFLNRFQVVEPEDGQWGNAKADGSWSGMIGMVDRQESHFAIDEITMTCNAVNYLK